jgi:hypothetical protein
VQIVQCEKNALRKRRIGDSFTIDGARLLQHTGFPANEGEKVRHKIFRQWRRPNQSLALAFEAAFFVFYVCSGSVERACVGLDRTAKRAERGFALSIRDRQGAHDGSG